MPSAESRVDKSLNEPDLAPSRDSTESTDRSDGTSPLLNEAPQYFRSLELEFLRVMDRDLVAKQFYDMATVSYHGTHENGLKAAIIALSNAARNRTLRNNSKASNPA